MGRGKNSDKFKELADTALRKSESEKLLALYNPSKETILVPSTDNKEETKKLEINKKKKQYMEDLHQNTAVSMIKDITIRKELADQHGIPFEEVSSPEDQMLLKAINNFKDKKEIDKVMRDIESGKKPAAPSFEAWWNDTQDQYAMPALSSS